MKRMCQRCASIAGVLAALAAGCGGKTAPPQRDAQSYFDEAQQALKRRNCLKAAELFQRVVINFPGSVLADDAQFGVGEAKLCSKEYTEAIFEYQRLIDEYPNSPLAAEGRYKIAVCYAKQSGGIHLDQTETRKAIAEYQRFIDDYPDSPQIPQARQEMLKLKSKLAAKDARIAEDYLKWGYPESARIYYQRILDTYGDTPWTENARLGLAVVKARKGEIDAALTDLRQLLSDGVSTAIRKRAQKQIEEIEKKRETSRKDFGPRPGATGRPSGRGVRPGP